MKNRSLNYLIPLIIFLLIVPVALTQDFGVKKIRPRPHEYGNVVMNNYSEEKGMAPVVFPHWLHRAKYTCRLCHVDVGFAMEAGGTGMTEEENRLGMYCGACHNGGPAFTMKDLTGTGGDRSNCDRCHSYGKKVEMKNDFLVLKKGLPGGRFGNGIDWIKGEEEGKIKLIDYIEGISIKRKKLKNPEDLDLSAKEPNMPDIVFSHAKHSVWNGCELCHPEIFPVKKDTEPYSMQQIFDGMYCGVCHGKVAFPSIDCQRCHTGEVN